MTADLGDIFRREAGRLVPYLLRRLGPRHLDLAEDSVQDAFVEALRHWPAAGVPADPRAWLLKAAHRKALDRIKRQQTAERNAHLLEPSATSLRLEPDRDLPDEIAVLLLACHPELPRDAQMALALRTLGGLSTLEVARALLITESAAAQRIVRAKKAVGRAGAPSISDADLDDRIDAALDVLYLVYSEGHHATAGESLVRTHLVTDAIHLATQLASSRATERPNVHALLSLMYFGAARLATRADDIGDLVLLGEQDRSRWNAEHIARAFHHLDASSRGPHVSRFHLEAGIASIHAAAPDAGSTDWREILRLYNAIDASWPSPVVTLNRSVAVMHVHGAEEAQRVIAPALADPSLASYAPLHATAAEFARRMGEDARAAEFLDRAIACPGSEPQRRFLERRRAALRLARLSS